jgi:hypothetical protein
MFSAAFSSGQAGGNGTSVRLSGELEFARGVPSRLV